jgi:hypothetical protein
MTREQAIDTAYEALRAFSSADLSRLRALGVSDDRAIGFAHDEIAQYPREIVSPPEIVKERANVTETLDGSFYVDLPFVCVNGQLADLELRVWIRDLSGARQISQFDVLVP